MRKNSMAMRNARQTSRKSEDGSTVSSSALCKLSMVRLRIGVCGEKWTRTPALLIRSFQSGGSEASFPAWRMCLSLKPSGAANCTGG
jgi:hypothetical protein